MCFSYPSAGTAPIKYFQSRLPLCCEDLRPFSSSIFSFLWIKRVRLLSSSFWRGWASWRLLLDLTLWLSGPYLWSFSPASSEHCCNLAPERFVPEAATGARWVVLLLCQVCSVQAPLVPVQSNQEFGPNFHCCSVDFSCVLVSNRFGNCINFPLLRVLSGSYGFLNSCLIEIRILWNLIRNMPGKLYWFASCLVSGEVRRCGQPCCLDWFWLWNVPDDSVWVKGKEPTPHKETLPSLRVRTLLAWKPKYGLWRLFSYSLSKLCWSETSPVGGFDRGTCPDGEITW